MTEEELRSAGIIDADNNLTPSYDAARTNWGGSWRMPTKAECQELRRECTCDWITQNGVNGFRVTGPNGNSIFLPAAGGRNGTSHIAVSTGYYWGSATDGTYHAYGLCFYSDYHVLLYAPRYHGQSVRPVTE